MNETKKAEWKKFFDLMNDLNLSESTIVICFFNWLQILFFNHLTISTNQFEIFAFQSYFDFRWSCRNVYLTWSSVSLERGSYESIYGTRMWIVSLFSVQIFYWHRFGIFLTDDVHSQLIRYGCSIGNRL